MANKASNIKIHHLLNICLTALKVSTEYFINSFHLCQIYHLLELSTYRGHLGRVCLIVTYLNEIPNAYTF